MVTPINPTTLTAGGGVLANGTENVTILCNCTANGVEVEFVRWYRDGYQLVTFNNKNYMAGSPYYTRPYPHGDIYPDNRYITLVIPIFTDSYDGTYTCGRRLDDLQLGTPNVSVDLTISEIGELMSNTVSYHIV